MRLLVFFAAHFLLLFSAQKSLAQAGQLDSTFGQNGVVLTKINANRDVSRALVLQPDGKILIGGWSETGSPEYMAHSAIARHLPNGLIDSTFGQNGLVQFDFGQEKDFVYDLAIQSDGKILAAGHAQDGNGDRILSLARLMPNGAFDLTFDGDGKMTIPQAWASDESAPIAVQSDGKILIGSRGSSGLFRLNQNGSLDATFGSNGKADIGASAFYIYKILIRPSGKILLGGSEDSNSESDFTAIQLLPNGSLDLSFGQNGMSSISFNDPPNQAWSAALQPDGKVILVGGAWPTYQAAYPSLAAIRMLPNGQIDPSFADAGRFLLDEKVGEAYAVAVQSDKKIVIGGLHADNLVSWQPTLVRLLENGKLDSSFGQNGVAKHPLGYNGAGIWDLAIQPADAKIVVTGEVHGFEVPHYYAFCAARFGAGAVVATVDFSKPTDDLFAFPNPISDSFFIEFKLEKAQTVSIELFDLSGRRVKNLLKKSKRMAGDHREALKLPAGLPSGEFWVIIETESGRRTVKIQKI